MLVLLDYLSPCGDGMEVGVFAYVPTHFFGASSEFNSCALYTLGDSWGADLVRMRWAACDDSLGQGSLMLCNGASMVEFEGNFYRDVSICLTCVCSQTYIVVLAPFL